MNDDNLSRRGAIMIDRDTLHARQMRRAAPKKLRVRHLPARANPTFQPFRPCLARCNGAESALEAGIRGIPVQIGSPFCVWLTT